MPESSSPNETTYQSDDPLTAEQLARLKPIRAGAPLPAGSILRGWQSLLFSAPSGKRPRITAKVTKVAHAAKREIWRVEINVAGAEPGARVRIQMKRVAPKRLRSDTGPIDTLHGHRPTWAGMSFKPRPSKPRPQQFLKVKGRRVRPLYIFHDRRQALTNSDYPWWCVGLIKSNRGTGTGALIGRNIVLTAGHVVPWDARDPWMTFSPGWNIPTISFGEWPLVRAHGYTVAQSPEDFEHVAHDMALVQLETPLGDTLGYFGAKVYKDRWDGRGYWTSVGYPDDWQGNPEFEGTDTVEDADSEDDGLYLETEASITQGNSGGPFFGWFNVNNGVAPYVVGVVSAEGAEAEIPRDHDNFAAGGDALVNLIAWGRAKMT
jgi:V8-like Glu-specific endopeptidase